MAAPQSLIYHTERLCSAIRQNTPTRFKEGVACYQDLVRQNLKEVLKCTFPIFYQMLSVFQLRELTERFLNEHSAEEPEFHHIATEWMRFMQAQPDMSARLLALMEYEWVLFSIEISPYQVAVPFDFSVEELGDFEGVTIRLNPTLIAITLPFILGGDNGYELSHKDISYAVYRKHNHDLCHKKLSLFDRYLINSVVANKAKSVGELKEDFSAYLTPETFRDWLLHNAAAELITFK